MAIRLPKFKVYTVGAPIDLPVEKWSPGMTAVPDELLGHHFDAALLAIGFDVDHPEDIRSGILNAEWEGHPAQALVIATNSNRVPVEPFAISEGAVG